MVICIGGSDWEIECNGEPVDALFNSDGQETFDPTIAAEVHFQNGELRELKYEDRVTYTFLGYG